MARRYQDINGMAGDYAETKFTEDEKSIALSVVIGWSENGQVYLSIDQVRKLVTDLQRYLAILEKRQSE